MKRSFWILPALLALGLLIETPALAQTPPKKVCLQWGAGPNVSVLTIKPRGSVSMSGGPVTFYSVVSELTNGLNLSVPMIGSGHMSGNLFHFQATGGTSALGPSIGVFTIEVAYEVEASVGVAFLSVYNDAILGSTSPVTALVPVDCRTVAIPYGKEAGGLSPFEDLLGPGWAQ